MRHMVVVVGGGGGVREGGLYRTKKIMFLQKALDSVVSVLFFRALYCWSKDGIYHRYVTERPLKCSSCNSN